MEGYEYNIEEGTPLFALATRLFSEGVLKDAYEVAGIVPVIDDIPPKLVQGVLKSMWDLPKHVEWRKECIKKATIMLMGNPCPSDMPNPLEDSPPFIGSRIEHADGRLIHYDYVSAYPATLDNQTEEFLNEKPPAESAEGQQITVIPKKKRFSQL